MFIRNGIKIFHSIYEMKYFFIIVLTLISLSNSTNPKLCVDCKFFKRDLFGNKFGKCSLFEKTEIADNDNYNDFLVDGIVRRKKVEYHYCSTARQCDDMCGKDGKLYEKNNFPIILLPQCPLSDFMDNIRNSKK